MNLASNENKKIQKFDICSMNHYIKLLGFFLETPKNVNYSFDQINLNNHIPLKIAI